MRQVALIAISLFVVGRLYAMQGVEAALTGLGGVALFGSMVWYSEFWAEYVLPLDRVVPAPPHIVFELAEGEEESQANIRLSPDEIDEWLAFFNQRKV